MGGKVGGLAEYFLVKINANHGKFTLVFKAKQSLLHRRSLGLQFNLRSVKVVKIISLSMHG